MQVDTLSRYPNIQAARMIVEEANKLVTFARYNITKDPVDEAERKRGVGDYAVWFQIDDCRPLTNTTKERASRILQQAEARALARELSRFAPGTALLRVWSLNPDNAPYKWNFRDS